MTTSSGVEKSWLELSSLRPKDVCRRAAVTYDEREGSYELQSLGTRIRICPDGRRSVEAGSKGLYEMVELYFDHAAMWYLIGAIDAGETGRQLRPMDLKGGHHFFTKGTHQLPLSKVAARYGMDMKGKDDFLSQAGKFGGRPLEFGDASVELRPMPRVPVQVILWLGDDEFEPRADLLFDSSAEFHCRLDVLWSMAMMSLNVLI